MDFKAMVESCGAIYVGVQKGYGLTPDAVLFQRIPRGSTISLFATACKNVHDVELALKADAEKFEKVPA